MNALIVLPFFYLRMVQWTSDCEDGDATACHSCGEYFSHVKRNYLKAAKIFHENCIKRNHPGSCFSAGRMYFSGRGVDQDDTIAAADFGKQGILDCQLNMPVFLYYSVQGPN